MDDIYVVAMRMKKEGSVPINMYVGTDKEYAYGINDVEPSISLVYIETWSNGLLIKLEEI